MHRLHMAAVAAVSVCALALIGTSTASAASPAAFTQKVAVTGTNKGKDFKGTYAIKRFVASGGKTYAVGTLSGTLKNRHVSRSNVRIPATLSKPAQTSQLPNPTPGACQVLDLVLNPIDLNLLGLHVATSRIEVLVEAIPGAGNLLGNLLCGITGILDPQSASANQLAAVLNSLLALVPTGPATAAAAGTR
ncbi:MAG: hypothetical protein QOE28_2315 [Solirubrobacteraceae bacterium]|nr:hypothetical protein [Solirubrobacteraceae bacterium]